MTTTKKIILIAVIVLAVWGVWGALAFFALGMKDLHNLRGLAILTGVIIAYLIVTIPNKSKTK